MARCPFAQWSTISLHSIHLSQFAHTPLRATTLCWPPTYSKVFCTGSGFPAEDKQRNCAVVASLSRNIQLSAFVCARLRYSSNCHRPLRVVGVAPGV